MNNGSTPPPIADTDIRKRMLFSMLRIRRVQEKIERDYLQDHMKTPVHLCIGQEAIAAGVCEVLAREDYISSNHRGHGHYLAKGGDLNALIAELHCRSTGCSAGFGGSMHIIDTKVSHLGSSSIVAGGIPLGTGMALASKMKNEDRVSVVFFGDGAADEGVLYESINFAILYKLPVVYVLENNKWAVCSSQKSRQAIKNVFHNAPQECLFSADIDGNNVNQVYQTALKAVERARQGNGPSLIECDTYRVMGHAGCKAQDPTGYRNPEEIEAWKKTCPIRRLISELEETSALSKQELEDWDGEIKAEIDTAFRYAMDSPLPTAEDVNGFLFCE